MVKDKTKVPLVAYHGTNRNFNSHNESKSRTALNEKYQGDWICYTTSKEVAEKYALAARNQNFDKDLFIEDLKDFLGVNNGNNDEFSKYAYNFFILALDKGHDQAWDELSEKYNDDNDIVDGDEYVFFRKLIDYMNDKLKNKIDDPGVDINDFYEMLEYVEGSNFYPKESDMLQDLINVFNAQIEEIPYSVVELHNELGFKRSKVQPQIYEAEITANKILETDDRLEAKEARNNGYDMVIYSGIDCVDDEPEILIAHRKQIKIKSRIEIHREFEELDVGEVVEKKSYKTFSFNERANKRTRTLK